MSLMVGREFDAGCKSRSMIVLPVCWFDGQLVELIYFLNDHIIGKTFGLAPYFF